MKHPTVELKDDGTLVVGVRAAEVSDLLKGLGEDRQNRAADELNAGRDYPVRSLTDARGVFERLPPHTLLSAVAGAIPDDFAGDRKPVDELRPLTSRMRSADDRTRMGLSVAQALYGSWGGYLGNALFDGLGDSNLASSAENMVLNTLAIGNPGSDTHHSPYSLITRKLMLRKLD
ncbi:MAG: hypothetical protein GF416_05100 [Candidatus Altiarchaeales archaeon]|nr:hypothetical protein [Candidatus Altiarchaeales archaeon]MBD3416493.1 hypothetical protein [Candidatus Altiarchaeales archaeon]